MSSRRLQLAALAALALALAAGAVPGAAAAKRLEVESVKVATKAGPLTLRVAAGSSLEPRLWVNGRRVRHGFLLTAKHAQTIELRAVDGLRPGPNRLRISAGGSTLRRQVRVPGWALLADAGPDVGTSVELGRRLGVAPAVGGRGPVASYEWRIVGGPRGARLALRGKGRARPLLRPRVPGTYVLQLRVQPVAGGRPSFDRVTIVASPEDPPIGAPIDTFGANGIAIGGKSYGAADRRISFVLLDRLTRTELTRTDGVKTSGSVAADGDGIAALRKLAEEYGNPESRSYLRTLMIFSSRGGIPKERLDDFGLLVKSVGATHLSAAEFGRLGAGDSGFSVVGIPGAPAGAATVLVGGGGSQAKGGLSGYLQKSQVSNKFGAQFYDFVSPDHPAFDTRSASSANSNTMLFNGSAQSVSFGTDFSAGFQMLVLDPFDGRTIENVAIKTNAPGGGDRALQAKAAEAMKKAMDNPLGPTVMVQSVGKPKAAGPEWGAVVGQLARLGANQLLVNALDGTTEYAIVGRVGSEQPPAEASTAYDHGPYGDPKYPPARLLGMFSRTRSGGFEPTVYSTPGSKTPGGTVNLGLVGVAYQPSSKWPDLTTNPREEGAVSGYICIAIGYCLQASSCQSLRACYWQRFGSHEWATKLGLVDNLRYPDDRPPFSKESFLRGQDIVAQEVAALASLESYLDRVQAPLDRSTTGSYIDLQAVGQRVYESLQRPPSSSNTSWILGLIGKVAAVGGFAGKPVSQVAYGLSASFGLLSYLSAETGQPILGGEIKVKTATLAKEMVDRIDLAQEASDGLGMIIASDHDKLMAASRGINGDWAVSGESATGSKMVRTAAQQWFYESLVPAAYPYLIRGYALAQNLRCGSVGWPKQPNNAQMLATIGYDGAGNPQKAVFFFARGIGSETSPPESLPEEMFRPQEYANPGLGMEKMSFFSPRVFGGRVYHAVDTGGACELGWLPRK